MLEEEVPYQAYQYATHTLKPAEQMVMIYSNAISYMQQAVEAINNKNYDMRYRLIDKTAGVIKGLRSSLMHIDAPEDLIDAFLAYYDAIEAQLVKIQCDDDLSACERVIDNLHVIRDTWVKMASQAPSWACQESTDFVLPPDERPDGGFYIVV
mgnify:CR=1 FL=1